MVSGIRAGAQDHPGRVLAVLWAGAVWAPLPAPGGHPPTWGAARAPPSCPQLCLQRRGPGQFRSFPKIEYCTVCTLIKKKIKFSSYIRKFEWSSCKVIYEEGLPHIWDNAQIFPHTVYEEAVSHIWLCNCSTLNFLIYEGNFVFFVISVRYRHWEDR